MADSEDQTKTMPHDGGHGGDEVRQTALGNLEAHATSPHKAHHSPEQQTTMAESKNSANLLEDPITTPKPDTIFKLASLDEQVEKAPADYFSPSAVTAHDHRPSLLHAASSDERKSGSTVSTSSATALAEPAVAIPESARDVVSAYESGSIRPRAVPRRSLTDYSRHDETNHDARRSPKIPDINDVSSLLEVDYSSHILPYLSTNTSTSATSHRDLLVDRGVKTTSNTPVHTPGLFSPRPLRQATVSSDDTHSTFPSPYLNPVQPQIPKETRIADRGVDTFSGRKLINQYEIQSELGRGVHGKVKLARNLETGEFVAIKIVQRYSKRRRLGRTQTPEDKAKKEIAILKKVHHPNVVSMKEVIDDPEISKIYLVLEFCELREIDWRHEGSKEIVIIENRRLEREAQGLNDPSFGLSNERLLKTAEKRREKARRLRPSLPLRSNSDFWSLEYAGETEDDLDDESEAACLSEPVSRAASRISSLAPRETDTSVQSQDFEAVPPRIPSTELPDSPQTRRDSMTSDSDLAAFASESDFGSYQPLNELSNPSDRQPLPSSWAHITNSIHSSQSDTEGSRGRQPSVAESATSQITELMESELPEDFRYVPTMTLGECRAAFRDAVLGLEYLHYQGIIHRDIKPANLLRTVDHRVKISDFGVSYLGMPIREGKESEDVSETESNDIDEETELAKTVGTPAFYAPELCTLDLDAETKAITHSIDIWALGVTLYCLLFGRTPFIAENEFVLMRRIADEDIFISRKRLKAVDSRPTSRSNSRGPLFRQPQDRRLPHELVHEDIDEDLHDLLRRLLIKDPVKRITLTEIKHHPWVLRDVDDPLSWVEQTDPTRQTYGKIEISKQEVADAVIPLKVIERAKSMVKRVSGVLGLGVGRSSRKRSKSGVGRSDTASSSLPPPPTASRDTRRHSLRPEVESISSALKHYREHHDHPLAQSVIVSPSTGIYQTMNHPTSALPKQDQYDSSATRPAMPDRHDSSMSTAASLKTIRQADVDRAMHHPQRSSSPLGPETQNLFEPPSTAEHSVSHIFNSRSILRSMRDRRLSPGRSPILSAIMDHSDIPDNLHGEPSVALSNTQVIGHMDSQVSDEHASAGDNDSRSPADSRTDTSTLLSHEPWKQIMASSPLDNGSRILPFPSRTSTLENDNPQSVAGDKTIEQQYRSAQETNNRRRIFEEAMTQDRAAISRPNSACPPSPDDNEEIRVTRRLTSDMPPPSRHFLTDMSPRTVRLPMRNKPLSSASSEDPMNSGISQSASFPSIPSAISADSSVLPDEEVLSSLKEDSADSDSTAQARNVVPRVHSSFLRLTAADEDDGYAGDGDLAVESQDSDSDSDEEFLVMGRVKSRASYTSRSNSATRPTKMGDLKPLTTPKNTRSGSSNTVKKVITKDLDQ